MSRKWKKRAVKTAAKLLAAVLTVTTCLAGAAAPARAQGYGKNGVVRNISSQQLVEDMGLGYNIGNTFDSIGSFITLGDPWEYQKGWGNDPVSKHFIQKVKEGGFKTIRFPVSWSQWIDDSNQINPGYMNVIQTVVDWCMEEDMYVILNIHHDSGAADTSWVRKAATDWDWTSKRYEAVWTQIAENFKGYGDHLIFEGMNEVEFPDAPNMSAQYEILNRMNQLFVDTVRRTGGNNGERHLLIPGYNTDIKKTSDRRYQMPEDPAGHCILSIHYYSPSPFCVAEHDVDWAVPVTTWGSDEDIRQVEEDLDMLAEHFLSKGVPVIIGEYGVLTEDNKEKESIRRYLSTVPEIIMQYGMCPILWDTSNAGDMKFIERISGEFYDPQIKSNYQALSQKKASGQIVKRQFDYPDYKQVEIPVSPGGWASLAAFEPEKILGISFQLECTSDWDSYGGGGIYLDSWDDTISYQFNSVFDEVTHIFTPEEKARLKDQLAVLIWWTDESNGGSRREELSLKGGKITLLYGEDDVVNVPGTLVSGSSAGGGSGSGSGGSSGGSGSGGSGTSSKPNYSTDPAGGSDHDGTKSYGYVLKKDRASAPEGDDESGVQKLDLAALCPGYQPGDTVKVTVSPMSDGGYSFALQAVEEGAWLNSDSWGPSDGTECSWECTPDDGKAAVYLWYLGGSYFMFNVKAEITKKAPAFEEISVGEGEEKEYNLETLFRDNNIPSGKRVKLSISTDAADDGEPYSGEVVFTDANGAAVSGIFGDGNKTAVVVGNPKDGTVTFRMSEGGIRVTHMKVELLADEPDTLAEFAGVSRAEFPKSQIELIEGKEGEESGLKVYFEFDGEIHDGGSISAQLVVNNTWNPGYGNDAWEIKEDADGTYIWYGCDQTDSVLMACWYNGGIPLKVKKLVQVKAKAASQEEFPAFEVTKDAPVEGYSIKKWLEESGIPEGSRIKVMATVQAEGSFGGEAAMTDQNGSKVVGTVSSDQAGTAAAVMIGRFEKASVDFKVNDDSQADGYLVMDIQVERAEGDAIGEIAKAGRLEFAPGLIEKKELEEEAESGLKVYYEYAQDVKEISSNLIVNGDWNYGNESWTVGEDSRGAYIWYGCDQADSVMIGCWYLDGTDSWRITGLVYEIGKETDVPDPTPELKENEVLAEVNEDGSYSIPEGEGTPSAIRFKASTGGKWGATLVLALGDNGWASGSGWISFGDDADTSYEFPAGTEFDKLSFAKFDDGSSVNVEYMIFVYKEETPEPEPDPVENEIEVEANEDGSYSVPEGRGVPLAIRFVASTGGKWGTSLALILGDNGWAEGSQGWISFADNEETTYSFEDGVAFDALRLGDADVSRMIFIYSDDAELTGLQLLALGDNEEVLEVNAKANKDGVYYLPDRDEKPMGIRAEVPSGKKVTLVFDEGDWEAAVIPDNKTVWYFFDEDTSMESVQIRGQKEKAVTFLYWNGESGTDTEEEDVFALSDYRIPAAIRYFCSTEEERAFSGSLAVWLYDRDAANWQTESKKLTEGLSAEPGEEGWYILTEKNRSVLKDVFQEARKAGVAPRLQVIPDDPDYVIDSILVYYDTPYTDDVEITGTNEEAASWTELRAADQADDSSMLAGKAGQGENDEPEKPEEEADAADKAEKPGQGEADEAEKPKEEADAVDKAEKPGRGEADEAEKPEEEEDIAGKAEKPGQAEADETEKSKEEADAVGKAEKPGQAEADEAEKPKEEADAAGKKETSGQGNGDEAEKTEPDTGCGNENQEQEADSADRGTEVDERV